MRPCLPPLLALALCLTASACSTSEEDLCDLECDCRGCSDREYDDCLDHYDNSFNDADRRGCLDLYDDLLACEDDTGRCGGSEWETSCKPERDDLKRCVDGKK